VVNRNSPAAAPALHEAALPDSALPASAWAALGRGLLGRCPRCAGGGLFRRWLKPHGHCPACAVDWSPQQADDFPAYISILLTGHLLAPVIIALVVEWDLGPGALAAILLPLTVALMLGLLQPAKGAVIALQWWHGLNGFRKERRAAGPV